MGFDAAALTRCLDTRAYRKKHQSKLNPKCRSVPGQWYKTNTREAEYPLVPTLCERVLLFTDDPSKHTHCAHCYFSIRNDRVQSHPIVRFKYPGLCHKNRVGDETIFLFYIKFYGLKVAFHKGSSLQP